MKILAISDIHCNTKAFAKMSLPITNSDLIIISGDLTRSGSAAEALDVLSYIERYNRNILAVHGNIDRLEVLNVLEDKGYNIHGKCKIINDIAFFGVGGSSPTPVNTATEYTESEIADFLKRGYEKISNSIKNILITHAPPKGIRDRTFLGLRGGSRSIKEFLKNHSIDLCLSGHIHEAYGIEKFNSTIVANPGSFKKGKYLSIEINSDIKITHYRVN